VLERLVDGIRLIAFPNRSATCVIALQLDDVMAAESYIGKAFLRFDFLGSIR
jgi:hypothetical protein